MLSELLMHLCYYLTWYLDFPGDSDGKASACNEGDLGSIPGSGRSPGEGNGNPLQYSCLENPMDGRAWWATIHGVAESQTQLSDFTFTFTFNLIFMEFQFRTNWSPKVVFKKQSLFKALVITSFVWIFLLENTASSFHISQVKSFGDVFPDQLWKKL